MRRRLGFSTIEYALLLVIVVAALVGVQRYLKAGLMGRWKASVDVFGQGQQFEPGVTVMTKGKSLGDGKDGKQDDGKGDPVTLTAEQEALIADGFLALGEKEENIPKLLQKAEEKAAKGVDALINYLMEKGLGDLIDDLGLDGGGSSPPPPGF